MNVLADAQVLIWAADNPAKLSLPAADTLQDPRNALWINSGTVWEMESKWGSANYR